MLRLENPSHPGQFLREEVLMPLNLSVTHAAKILSVSRPALSALLNARATLSPDMALRFEKAFGLSMDTLLRMQTSYDIAITRKRSKTLKIARYHPASA
jgi:antitoxin HigA-1